ncbi:hypothetical protein V2J09_020718 [Rumex salicifolius]
MATMTNSANFLQIKSPYSSTNLTTTALPNLTFPSRHTRPRRKLACISMAGVTKTEDVVIVGAGIAGLATAVSLHRLGIRSLVLEQSDSLRTGGTSLTLFKNGWSVLDALGVGEYLRTQFLEIEGIVVKSDQGKELRSFRKILLETLANELPPDSIRFSSKLSNIQRSEDGNIVLDLVDGSQVSSKIVVGCDGIRSSIAKWMGFVEPKYVGYSAFRGLAFYPEGQPHGPRVNYVYGQGLRAGFVPVSPNKVYWFVCYNIASPGPKITDQSELKKQARSLVKTWPNELLRIIDQTPEDTIIRTPLEDRWLWPSISPSASKGKAVLAGDAWHPMTPNLGQGGCCALEDAIVLAKKLAHVLGSSEKENGIEEALLSYERERWPRIFPLAVRANLVGALLQWENPVVCYLRNELIVPKVIQMGPLLEHTNFSCEPL